MKTSRSHERHLTQLMLAEASNALEETQTQWRFFRHWENEHLMYEGVEESMFHELERRGLIAENGHVRQRNEYDDYWTPPGIWSPESCAARRRREEERQANDPYHPIEGIDLLFKGGYLAVLMHIGQNGDRAAYRKLIRLR